MIKCRIIMNKTLKQFAIFTITLIGLFVIGYSSVQAQYGPYEGPSPSGQILIDKKIKNPASENKGGQEEWVDNLDANDYHFSPGENISFKITVKNTGNTTFEKAEVKDLLPQYVDYVLGSGDINKDIRDITSTHGELKPDQVWEFYLTARAYQANEIPNDQGLYCVINTAEVWSNGHYDRDTAQLCIEKEVLGAKIIPPTGANIFTLGLSFVSLSGLGLLLKKKLILFS